MSDYIGEENRIWQFIYSQHPDGQMSTLNTLQLELLPITKTISIEIIHILTVHFRHGDKFKVNQVKYKNKIFSKRNNE